jgi:ABC-2 type transport system permease protein
MNKIMVVTWAEYLRAVRSKAFLIGVLVTPLLFGAGIIAMSIAEASKDVRERQFSVLDGTGELLPLIEQRLAERNGSLMEDGEQTRARWTLQPPPGELPDGERLDLALSQRIEEGELFGFLKIGAGLMEPEGGDRTLVWHTATPTSDDLPDWLEGQLNSVLRHERLSRAGIDASLAGRLSKYESVSTLGPVTLDASGEVEEDSEFDQIARVIVPVALVVIMFMLVMMSTPALMNNVLEEKMQKIAEVLVSSVTPFELLMGKLFSAVAMSLTLALIYVGGALIFLNSLDSIPPQILAAVTPGLLGWFLVFLLLSLIIDGAIFSALGAACSELQDAQTLMMPAMIVIIAPMMFLGPLIQAPDSTLARVLTFIPPVAPVVLFLRINVPPGAELWEVLLALGLCVVFTWYCVKAAGKIFRIGVLSQGQAPSYRKLVGWLFSD